MTEPVSSSENGPEPRKVLVIDDEESVRAALQASIETFPGFEVDTAPDGEIGLEMIGADRYFLVLVDLIMPIVDGFEVLRQLRTLDEDHRPERVVLVSAMVDPTLRANVLEFGGDAILSKPFRLDDLRKVLAGETEPL